MLVGDFILPVITSSSPWVVDGLGGAAIATAIAGVHARGDGGSDSPFR
jgi:hypothetical protein